MITRSRSNNSLKQASFASCRAAVLKSWDTVFREDVFAVEGMQAGRDSPGFDGGVLTPVQDIPTQHFHSWVARQYMRALD
jgi:choline monooxygenase